jgi:HAD superfamily hydrolase (TIGR01509 family)
LRAVLFDGFGTLLTTQPEASDALKEACLRRAHAECDGVVKLPPFAQFLDAYKAERAKDHAERQDATAEFDFPARMQRVFARLGLGQRQSRALAQRAAARYMRELGNATRLLPDAQGILNRVPDGVRCALVSNFPDGPALRAALERVGMLYGFEALAISGELRRLKPDARVFREALEALDVAPEDAVMVGNDEAHDVAPAKALGMRAVLVCFPRGIPPPARTQADAVVGTLAELPPLLGRWAKEVT